MSDNALTGGRPKISANSAAFSQLSSLPQEDRERVVATLVTVGQGIGDRSGELPANVKRVGAEDLFVVRIDDHLRATLKLNSSEPRVELIAIGRKEDLESYAQTLRRAG